MTTKPTYEELLIENKTLKQQLLAEKAEKRALELMIKNSNDTFVLLNEKGEQFYISDAATRDTGYEIADLLGPFNKVILPEDQEKVLLAWEKALQNKNETIRVQYRHIHKYKDYIWYEAVAHNYLDNPEIKAIVVNVRDITAIKEAEAELKKNSQMVVANNANITAILEGTQDSIWAFDKDYIILYINQRFQIEFQNAFGILLKPGSNLLESLPTALRPLWKIRYDRVLANEQYIVEDTVETDFGTLYIQVCFNPITINSKVIGGSCFGSNITPRKLIEKEIIKAKELAEENEDRLRAMFHAIPDMVFRINGNGQFIDYKADNKDLYYIQDSIIGKHFAETLPMDLAKLLDQQIQKTLLSGQIQTFEYSLEKPQSGINYYEARMVKSGPNETTSIVRNISEKKAMEDKLNQITANTIAIVENSLESIWSIDANFRITYINEIFKQNYKETFGIELVPGANVVEVLPQEYQELWYNRYRKVLKGERFVVVDKVTTPQTTIHYEISMSPIKQGEKLIGASMSGRNISHQIKAEEELKAREKRAGAQRMAITTLALDRNMVVGDTALAFMQVSKVVSQSLEVARTSIWMLDDSSGLLQCQALYQAQDNSFSYGTVIEASQLPAYFNALKTENRIYAEDALNDKRTIELANDYLKTLGITSLLDAGIFKDGSLVGVVCSEHVGPKRTWYPDEESFIATIAAFVSQLLSNSERLIAEEQLRKSRDQFQSLVNNIPGITFRCKNDENWTMLFISSNIDSITGYSADELINNKVTSYGNLNLPEDNEQATKIVQQAIEENRSWETEYRVKHKNGSIKWVYEKGQAVRDLNGKVQYLDGFIIDITERKQSEIQLRKLYQAVEQSPVHIIITNIKGEIEYVNPKFTEVTGYPHDEVKGKKPSLLKSGEHPPQMYSELWNTISTGNEWRGEFHNKKKNGDLFWESAAISPIVDNNGKITHFLAIKEDITERKKANQELIAAKEKAEESDRLKTAFLQNMSHEIRTPMNAIIGFSSLLSDNFDDKDNLEHYSDIINQRCNDLLEIINGILDISKIESGQTTINKENFNIDDLFAELGLFFSDYQRKINKPSIKLILHPVKDKDTAMVRTDKIKLKQILINLIGNAFKFTERGTIDCGAYLYNNKLHFFVTDTGIGIAKDKFGYIFERFTQVNHPTMHNTSGTGLGLPIVKGLVGILGGEVWLESLLGKGTTFFFNIESLKPVNSNNKPRIQKTKPQLILSNMSVLVVEDDTYNAQYINAILKNLAINTTTVTNGADAVETSKLNHFDIVLMDIRLPDITGYEAAKQILKFKPHTKIIAQTAYAANEERQVALNAGCVDYLSKPTTQAQLIEILRKHLNE
jgi:PAS domain S-box-containing protein